MQAWERERGWVGSVFRSLYLGHGGESVRSRESDFQGYARAIQEDGLLF